MKCSLNSQNKASTAILRQNMSSSHSHLQLWKFTKEKHSTQIGFNNLYQTINGKIRKIRTCLTYIKHKPKEFLAWRLWTTFKSQEDNLTGTFIIFQRCVFHASRHFLEHKWFRRVQYYKTFLFFQIGDGTISHFS